MMMNDNNDNYISPHKEGLEERAAKNQESNEAIEAGKLLLTITSGELMKKDLPPAEMLLEPWLKRGTLALIFAGAGVGKTWVALSAAVAIAKGSKVFDRWSAPEPKTVLYIDGEMSIEEMQERLKLLGAPDDNILLYNPDLDRDTPAANLALYEWQDRVLYTIKKKVVDVVIIDNIASLYRNSENSNGAESWAIMQEFILKLRREKKGVIMVDHTPKDREARTARGTSAKNDVLDIAIQLRRPENYEQSDGAKIVIQFTKNRGLYGNNVKTFMATLSNGQWQTEDYTDPPRQTGRPQNDTNYHAVVECFNAGITSPKELHEQTGISIATVNRYLKMIRDEIRTGYADKDGYHLDEFDDYQ